MNGKLEDHLRNIRDFVQIDDKIVTYKWISKALKVHTNTAKQLLYSFTNQPQVKDQLLATYVVTGELHGDSGLSVHLVREDELEEKKKKFAKVTSVHVYSVQKGDAVSAADIYNAESAYKLSPEDQKYCSIQPAEDIKLRQIRIRPPSNDSGHSVATKKPLISQSTEPADNNVAKGSHSTKHESEREATKGISPRKTSPKKNDVKRPAAASKGGGIGALFKKQAEKKKEDTAVKAAKGKEYNTMKTKGVPDENGEASKEEELRKKLVNGKEPEKETVKTPSSKPKSQSKKKRKKSSDSKDSAAKRRRRIQIPSESESSGESESDGDQRYPSPEPEPQAPTAIESEEEEIIPATPIEKGRKRVRKLVDRRYEDEEGYIITKKEYVFESCSDDESTEPTKNKMEPDTSSGSELSKAEEKNAKESQKQSASLEKKEDSKKKEPKKSEEGKITVAPAKKPGRPSRAKASVSNSPKKQASITSFFKKT